MTEILFIINNNIQNIVTILMDDVTTLTSDKVDTCFLTIYFEKKILCNRRPIYKYTGLKHFQHFTL